MAEQLTRGLCLRLQHAQTDDQEIYLSCPTVQFLSIKKISPTGPPGANAPDRYRIIMSDGEHFVQAMLATQLNHLIEDETIGKHSIVVLDRFTANVVQERRLIIILDLTPVLKIAEKIGDPSAITLSDQPTTDGDVPMAETAPTPAPARASAPSVSNTVPPRSAPQRSTPGNKSGGRQSAILPIEGLSPYQNNWTIKARVTQKSDIRTWSNQRGEGKLFNVTLMDESGEIRGTGFNDVVDALYEKFQEGKVYFISRARVNLAKKKFSNLANDYELSFERNTEVEECLDPSGVPAVKYEFTPLAELEQKEKDSTCDVLGVVKEDGGVATIVSKTTHKELLKRELTLVDSSGYSVRLTLWGKQAEAWNHTDNPVVAFKGVRVGDFGGRSLSMVSSSTMQIEPDIPEVHHLRGWYDGVGNSQSFQSHSFLSGGAGGAGMGGTFNRAEVKTLGEIRDLQLGSSDRPDNFFAQATVMHVRGENIAYPACPKEGCNKKVVQIPDGRWRCEKCDESYDAPEYRYIVSMAVADHTGQAWFQGFNDVGLAVFNNMSATELVQIKERDEAKFNGILHKAGCQTFNFSCRAKQDTFGDSTRVRYGISRITPLDYAADAAYLRDLLKTPWAHGQ
ncbi:replication factor-a protein [Punctularia strigosozonata HHB-11173 SS5]|uniref:replication factor-a protein n=1 Tax=Punctularia strigosozonata (strain HHB-11173) TaxID=741275 RepID=UPI0004417E63|nr:replication factor-a protein [Punctularia strigosozonata HHB-11173 SS5]EIN07090.1 replication factor-a protein [Punctularia strigosozonata HHB-11173 SS5]